MSLFIFLANSYFADNLKFNIKVTGQKVLK